MPDDVHAPGILIVRILDELFTRHLDMVCAHFGWRRRHDLIADVHWVEVVPGTEHSAAARLRTIRWVVSVRRETKLRLL